MADIVPNASKVYLFNGSVDLDTDSFYIMLTTGVFVPDIDTLAHRSDVTNELPASGGYVAGGFALTGTGVTQDNLTNKAVFDANDWVQSLTFAAARYGIMYKRRGGLASADEVVKVFDFGVDRAASGTFTIQFPAEGILVLEDR